MKETADAAVAQVPSVHTVVVVPRLGRADVPMQPGRDLTLADVDRRSARSRSTRSRSTSEHPLFVAYTSGTTGRPKGAVHVHGGFLAKIAEEVAFQMDLRPRRAPVLADRHRLDHGAVGDRRHARQRRHARALRRRARLPGPDRLWSIVEQHRVAILGVSPTLVRALMAHGDEPVQRARPVVAARARVDGRTVERGAVALVLRRRRRRAGARSSTSRAAPRSARASCRRTSCNRCRRVRSAAPRSGWPSTCSTTTGTRCAASSVSSCARSRGRE